MCVQSVIKTNLIKTNLIKNMYKIMYDSKMKKSLTWPNKSHFVIKDLFALNPTEKDITMRTHVDGAKKLNEIVAIGTVPGFQGRPQLVYAYTPVTKITIERAKADGYVIDNEDKIINVVDIKSPVSTTTPVSDTMFV